MKVYPEEIDCVYSGDSGSIYISNIEAARNIQNLKRFDIRAVVTAARGSFLPYNQAQLPNYLYIPAQDVPEFDMEPYFLKTFDFIDKNLKRSNVLVHCVAGISRSVTLVVAYIMKKHGRSFDDVLGEVRRKRPISNPNIGFVRQLRKIGTVSKDSRNMSSQSRFSSSKQEIIKTKPTEQVMIRPKSQSATVNLTTSPPQQKITTEVPRPSALTQFLQSSIQTSRPTLYRQNYRTLRNGQQLRSDILKYYTKKGLKE